MAKTPAQIDALDDYTNAQMVKLIRWCIAELTSNPESQVSGVGGKLYTMRDMDQLQRMLEHFQQLAAADTEAADLASYGCPVVTRQEPQI